MISKYSTFPVFEARSKKVILWLRLFCIGLVSVVHLRYIYIPTLLILLPAGLIISTLFCTVAATLLFYYMREAYRRAKYYTDPKNQIN